MLWDVTDWVLARLSYPLFLLFVAVLCALLAGGGYLLGRVDAEAEMRQHTTGRQR